MAMVAVLIMTICTIAVSYVAVCGLIYIIEEVNSTVKKVRRNIRDAIWELEWKWKLFKEYTLKPMKGDNTNV